MKGFFLRLFCMIMLQTTFAQTPPQYTWVRNLTGATGYSGILTNVQSVYSTTTDVYVSCTCIPGYSIGPWSGNPNVASNQNFCFKITRNPVQNTGTATAIGNGHTGVWTNGVSIFNVSDAQSYNNAGVWFRNAYYWEGSGFDNCLGHPQQQGEYHHHVSPKCLYATTDSTHHSPIIGYAFDGYPVYGAYGYTNTNGTGAIKRMKSSYAVSTATTRINGPAVSSTYPAGCFIQDWIYTGGSGDLDTRNGRFCVTPEYPSGTYAYFVTIDASLTPTFPYTMYGSYYGVVQTGNTGTTGGHNVIPGTAAQYTNTLVPAITIATTTNSICSGSSITFTTTITNGGTAPLYQWKKNNVSIATGSSYTTSSLVNGDSISCTITSNAYYLTATTATSNSIRVTVTNTVIPSVSISTNATTICAGTSVAFTAAPTNGGATPSYQWKKNGNNVGINSPVYSDTTLADNNIISCVMTSNANCATPASATSNAVTIVTNCPPITFNLKLFLEGFYIGNGTMRAILDPVNHPEVCDSLTVEFHNAISPYALVKSVSGVISTTGNGSFILPSYMLNGNYYLSVKCRNSINTWCKYPLTLNSNNVSYDMTTQ